MVVALVSLRAICFKEIHMREQNVTFYSEEKHKEAASPTSDRKHNTLEKSRFEEPAVATLPLHFKLLTPLCVFWLPQQDTCPYAYVGKEKIVWMVRKHLLNKDDWAVLHLRRHFVHCTRWCLKRRETQTPKGLAFRDFQAMLARPG